MDDRLEKATELFAHANQLETEADAVRQAARRIQNEALEELVPFNVGDIIEYTTMVGWRPPKRQTRRMKVQSLNVAGDVVAVRGLRFNAKLERSSNFAYIHIPSEDDQFVKVLKPKE